MSKWSTMINELDGLPMKPPSCRSCSTAASRGRHTVDRSKSWTAVYVTSLVWNDRIWTPILLFWNAPFQLSLSSLWIWRLGWAGHVYHMGDEHIPKVRLQGELAQGLRPVGWPHQCTQTAQNVTWNPLALTQTPGRSVWLRSAGFGVQPLPGAEVSLPTHKLQTALKNGMATKSHHRPMMVQIGPIWSMLWIKKIISNQNLLGH